MKNIAYLAPEIPSLSTTFVYNEIIELQKKGCVILPVSVHFPANPATGSDAVDLAKHIIYLYPSIGGAKVFWDNVAVLTASPYRYLKGLAIVLWDALSTGLSIRTRIGLIYRFFFASPLARILRFKRCTHLHANFSDVPTDIAMYGTMLAGIPFSFTSHANDLFETAWLLPRKIARSKFAVTISDYNKQHLISLGGEKDKIHVIHCGVDDTRFTEKNFASSTSPPYKIGILGRMVEKKGFDILLKAATTLKEEGIDFKLSMAGDGPLADELRRICRKSDLMDSVEFIGSINHEKVPEWLKSLDLFVLPCKKDQNGDMDGIPVALMEAMLTGVAVISTRLSGIPELIMHEQEGFLVSPGSVEELAVAMRRLLADNDLRKRCIANAKEKIKEEFSFSTNTQCLLTLITGNHH